MRFLLVSTIATLITTTTVAPTAAFAEEAPARKRASWYQSAGRSSLHPEPAAQVSQPSQPLPEDPDAFKPRGLVALDVGEFGVGVMAGVRVGYVELGFGADVGIFSGSEYAVLRVIPMPQYAVKPYVYGRAGNWATGFLEDEDSGNLQAVGGGLEMLLSTHTFLLAEAGYQRRTHTAAFNVPDEATGDFHVAFGWQL